MKILVPIDESHYSEAAIEQLGKSPWWGDTTFEILNIAPVPTVRQWENWGMDVDWNLRERILENSRELVAKRVEQLKKTVSKGLIIEGRVLETQGKVSEAIIEEARSCNADLIVMGTHDGTGIKRFFLGSTSQDVLAAAPCSVEIVKSPPPIEESKSKSRKENKTSAVY